MNLKRLRYFVVVADELHFGRAARRLHMAQPPLSQQIRLLEADLGVTLFDRSTRRVVLTAAGRRFHPEAKRLVREADALERRIGDFATGHGGTLRFGFVDSASYEIMPRFLRAYRRRWPDVDYVLRSMSSDEQHAALAAGEIDLGIGRAVGDPVEIRSTTLLDERLVLGVPADHRLADQQRTSLGRLAGEVFIGFDRTVSPSLHAVLRAMFAARKVAYDPVIEATEYTTILGLVASGQGIAVVPSGVRTFRPPDLRYLALSDRSATSSLLLFSRVGDTAPMVGNAIDLAAELFGTPARARGSAAPADRSGGAGRNGGP